MAISDTRPSERYTANGATTVFSFSFKALSTAHIKVYVNDVLQSSGYTVTLLSSSGSITFSAAPANGADVVILRESGIDRTEVYTERGSFLGDTVNNDFDKRQMAIQESKYRTIEVSALEAAKSDGGNYELPSYEAGKMLGWNEETRQLANFTVQENSQIIQLKAWTLSEAFVLVSATRNADNVITTATIKWPDGASGTFTTTTINATFNAIDAYTVTYVGVTTKTVTQAAVTRNSAGAVIAQPEPIIS